MPNKKTSIKTLRQEAPSLSTQTDTISLFEGRLNYLSQHYIYFEPGVPLVDTWYESTMFGKLNIFGQPIELKEEFLRNPTTNNTISTANCFILDFVADAFSDMRKEVEERIRYGKIKKTPVLNLLPKQNYQFLSASYKQREKFIIDSFINKLDSNNKFNDKIKNFDNFIKLFTSVLATLPNRRITKTNHLLSYKTPINVSGLVIELSENDPNNNLKKYEHFFNDENFKFFQKTCYKYGFLLDKNIPSRLIFHPTLPQALQYLQKYGIESTKDLFNKRYDRILLKDFKNFKKLCISCYNQIVKIKNYTQNNKICGNYKNLKFIKAKRITRYAATDNSISLKYNNLFWIKLYFYIFLKENEIKMTQQKFNSILITIELFYKMNESNAIKYLETLCCSIKQIPVSGLNLDPSSSLTISESDTILTDNDYKFIF